MIHAPMHPSWFACTACVLLALAAGAYRQWCIYFWERIELLPSTDDDNILPEDLAAERLRAGMEVQKVPNRVVALRRGVWYLGRGVDYPAAARA